MTTIEAICIGDELLEGRVRDANAAALGDYLAGRGYRLGRATFVGDEPAEIVAALRASEADVVVVCGGLGPTTDDRTREAAAMFAGCALVEDAASMRAIEARFAARGRELSENNRRQALFPELATPLPTSVGTAPPFRLERGERQFLFFPGVPGEFRSFMQQYVGELFPEVEGQARTVLAFHGLGESALEAKIADLVASAEAEGLLVGFRAEYPVIELKLAGESGLLGRTREQILARLTDWWIGEGDESLPGRLGRHLRDRGETVTTAESCTAGGIAALLTDVSGSSAWFGRGYVTYANEAKVEEVGVLESTLLAHGAVSPQTVCQMASGARRRARATYALAVSGIAGPGGGTPEKPVGTVHFALATEAGTFHRHVLFTIGDRAKVRAGTAYSALAMLLTFIERGAAALGHAFDEDAVWSEHGIVLPEES